MIAESLPDELLPHEIALFAIVREGLEQFKREFGPLRVTMTIRSERSNIHDCIFAEAAKHFEVIERLHLRVIKIGPYRLKVKKFSPRLQTRHNSTQLAFDFL